MDLQFGPYRLRRTERLVMGPEGPVELSARSFDILALLLERPDEVVGKTELLETVWPGLVVEDNTLQVHISALRKALEAGMIVTIHGRGYKYAGPRPDAVPAGFGQGNAANLPATEQPVQSRPSIAVLPFDNMSGDPEQAYFVDGLTVDLITDLSKVPQLFVIARNSTFAYKGRSVDVRQIARELGVKYVLEGSARRAADRVRINAQLIDAANGGHIWADRFDRDLADVFAMQDEVVGKIVEALAGKLTAANLKERYRPANLEAYDLCLRGRAEYARSPEAGVEAIPLFERAIALDPDYADAHRWLAFIQNTAWAYLFRPMDPHRQLSLASARRAVELDPNDSGTHWVLAYVLLCERRWDESSKEFEIALRLNPNDADAWTQYADLKSYEGRGVEAIACVEKAMRLNPHPPGWYFWTLGFAQYGAGQYDAAVKSLTNEATYDTQSRYLLAAALAQLGRLEKAREEAKLHLVATPQFSISRWIEDLPYRDMAKRDKLIEGLRKAGFPE